MGRVTCVGLVLLGAASLGCGCIAWAGLAGFGQGSELVGRIVMVAKLRLRRELSASHVERERT
jgi:hypothetical protein